MELKSSIFPALERRLQTRAAPPASFAMRLRIVVAVTAEIGHSPRRPGSIPAAWLGVALAMFAAMLQFAGSAKVFQSDEMPMRSSVAVTADMLKPLSDNPAERQAMAESLAFCDAAQFKLLPKLDSRFANFPGGDASKIFQETP